MSPPARIILFCFSLAIAAPLLQSAEPSPVGRAGDGNGASAPASSPAPPAAPTSATEETLYLLRYKSVETDSGLIGLPPGTAVVKVSDKGDTLLVRSGEHQFEVDKRDVTASTRSARKAAKADTIAQDKIAGVYHIPLAVVPELANEKKAIEDLQAKASKLLADLTVAKQTMDTAKARAEDSQTQLNRTAGELTQAKASLERSNRGGIENYNRQVAQYNQDRAAQQSLIQAANEQVARYNTLFTQFKAQNATITQMATEYNAKVKHYGK
ncbi:MAG: hypothetical protein P4L99_22515 [Chthoniobacter sp.]|nr:hypothetical protein [Chthoniobacter sp.]